MHSSDLPVSTGHQSSFSEAALRSHYVDLAQYHLDLDYLISAVSGSATGELVARLKKRKLRIKDEISRVVDELRSTGDAAAHP